MRRAGWESGVRFLFGLVFLGLLTWFMGLAPDGIYPTALWTVQTVGLAALYAAPVAMLFGLPAGLRPGTMMDRLLQLPVLLLVGVPAAVVLDLVLQAGLSLQAPWVKELLAVLIVGPWLAWAVRDGLWLARGRGGRVGLRFALGRVFQTFGNLAVVTLFFPVLVAPAGAQGHPVGLAVPALLAHLAGDLLVGAAPPVQVEGRERRTGRIWLAFGGLCLLAFLLVGISSWASPLRMDMASRVLPPGAAGHLLGTDGLGRDVAARLAAGVRGSLTVSGLAAVVAVLSGSLLAALSRRLSSVGGLPTSPIPLPSLLGPYLVGVAVAIIWPPSAMWLVLGLGLVAAPVVAHTLREWASVGLRSLIGVLCLVLAQSLLGEVLLARMGAGRPLTGVSLGGLLATVSDGPVAVTPHLLYPGVVVALGVGGLLLIGQALRE